MSDEGLEHIVLAVLAAIPATVAALSSLRNGREQSRVRKELAETNGKIEQISSGAGKSFKKKAAASDLNIASDPDWYKAPELWCEPWKTRSKALF